MAAYDAYEILRRPAVARSEPWRLVVGLLACVALFVVLLSFYRGLVATVFSLPVWAVELALFKPAGPYMTLILLFSFLCLIGSVALVLKSLHKRDLRSLLGPRRAALMGFTYATGAIGLLYLVLAILPPHDPYNVVDNPKLTRQIWLQLLPLSLFGVLIQTSAEELLFRGYLQSQLAARFRSPLVWIGVPALLFAVLHYDTSNMGGNATLVAIWAFVFGVLAADLTARTGTLGPAIGFHFVNNALALLYVGFADTLGGLALYHLPYSASEMDPVSAEAITEFGSMVVAWLAVRVALRR